MVLFDFSKDSDLSNWTIVDDNVMGGRSDGHFEMDKRGFFVFYGHVSLENNGGFSSVRYHPGQKKVNKYSKISILLKGDGKIYQLRIKSDKNERHSYIHEIKTSGEWQTISIPFSGMHPSFRGRALDIPSFPAQILEEVAFLISNNKEESFRLEIEKIIID